jgi:hypothetical protein
MTRRDGKTPSWNTDAVCLNGSSRHFPQRSRNSAPTSTSGASDSVVRPKTDLSNTGYPLPTSATARFPRVHSATAAALFWQMRSDGLYGRLSVPTVTGTVPCTSYFAEEVDLGTPGIERGVSTIVAGSALLPRTDCWDSQLEPNRTDSVTGPWRRTSVSMGRDYPVSPVEKLTRCRCPLQPKYDELL